MLFHKDNVTSVEKKTDPDEITEMQATVRFVNCTVVSK